MSHGDHNRSRAEREAAVRIVRALRERGHTAYLAGGCVRDLLMGCEPKDYDVATDARPEQIGGYFAKTASVGAAFGVMLVRDFGATIEVATFRSDGVYSDARRPDSIEFSSPQEDAKRRDFTINALFMDPLSDEPDQIIDYVCGMADVRDKVLRAVGEPEARLREDHLRALRAVRFAARYGLAIEPRTARAIADHASELSGVSVERIGEEMRRMLTHPSRVRACELIDELGLDDAIFADRARFQSVVMGGLGQDAPYPVALAALAIGRGHDPSEDPASVCDRYRGALDLSNTDRDAMRATLEILLAMGRGWDAMAVAGKKRLAARDEAPGALTLFTALCARDERQDAARISAEIEELAGMHGGLKPEPLVTGADLIDQGLTPGPDFKPILDDVYDAQLEGRVRTHEQARALAADLARNRA